MVFSARAGSTRARVTSSNTAWPRAFSTGTASRSLPSKSIAKPVISWPSSSGNCSSPSSWRAFGLKNTSSTEVCASRPATWVVMATDSSRMGISAPCTTRRGGGRTNNCGGLAGSGALTRDGRGGEAGRTGAANARQATTAMLHDRMRFIESSSSY